jgi:hypothetical protein
VKCIRRNNYVVTSVVVAVADIVAMLVVRSLFRTAQDHRALAQIDDTMLRPPFILNFFWSRWNNIVPLVMFECLLSF